MVIQAGRPFHRCVLSNEQLGSVCIFLAARHCDLMKTSLAPMACSQGKQNPIRQPLADSHPLSTFYDTGVVLKNKGLVVLIQLLLIRLEHGAKEPLQLIQVKPTWPRRQKPVLEVARTARAQGSLKRCRSVAVKGPEFVVSMLYVRTLVGSCCSPFHLSWLS